ncbi:hypothetical protein P152DRAFT_474889 [Eremomyces bilateralis CBS 781.70]|uniref:TEA domain-containing protein n=1 Tax=Eremomyces bilateralis CBS 781.70 TaxID=1392243 RepID=A0A6G1G040_9PEZI|nr:uncharacterized protein P152DRAFT_474889 [Eremomyces bilateralis CBS 781.70]KAF1811290.1 hypothetical protein P152DRAFT_474889 [Eremomyces bilateralis CBS 781.70]
MVDLQAGHESHPDGMVVPSSDLDISFDIHRMNNYLYRHLGSSHHVASPYPDGISVVTPITQDVRLETPTHSSLYNRVRLPNGHDLRTPSKAYQGRHLGHRRGHTSLPSAEDPALERVARNLMKRWERCPGYQQYRKRQPIDDDESKEKVWPPHLELAFCKALILYPPMGRKKTSPALGEPAMGRNELIAWAIMKWTNESRDRKKVSSHIQVLRPMFEKYKDVDPGLLKYFSNSPKAATGRRGCRPASQSMNRHRQFSHNTRAISSEYCYPNGTASASSTSTGSGVSVHPPRPEDIQEVCRYPSGYFSFVPTKFEMFVKQREKQIHLFTRSTRNCQGLDIGLDDIYHLRFDFPPLATEMERGSLQSQVIFNNARIGLAADSIPSGRDSNENELGVFMVLDCDSKHVSISEHVSHYFGGFRARTRFYDSGKLISDVPEETDRDQLDQAKPTYDLDNKTLGNVYFGSVFWAERMYKLGRVLREAAEKRAAGTIASDEAARSLEQRVSESVKRLSAVQEIWAVSRDSGQERRILAICWKFEHVMAQPCFTIWRHVVPGNLDLIIQPTTKTEQSSESKLASSLQEIFPPGVDIDANGNANGFGFDLQHDTDPFIATAHFDFTDMAMQLPPNLQHNLALSSTMPEAEGMVDTSIVDHALYPSNHIDFSGGHINICMPDTNGMMDDAHITTALTPLDMDMTNGGLEVDLSADLSADIDGNLDVHFVTSATYTPTVYTPAAHTPAAYSPVVYTPASDQSHKRLLSFEDGANPGPDLIAEALSAATTAAEMNSDVRVWACNGFQYFDVGFSAAPAAGAQFAEAGAGVSVAPSQSPVREEALMKLEGLTEGERGVGQKVGTPGVGSSAAGGDADGGRGGDGVCGFDGESI